MNNINNLLKITDIKKNNLNVKDDQIIKKTELNKILDYKCELAIEVFLRTHSDKSKSFANDIWLETLKFLWLCYINRIDNMNVIDSENSTTVLLLNGMYYIDEMWHSFILCTPHYNKFCNKYFGFYIHHIPSPKNKKAPSKKQLSKLTKLIDKHLGRKTTKKWLFSLH